MGRHVSQRTWSSVAAALACVAALLASGCAGSEELTCADSVMIDWNNGQLGSEYAPECYRDALEDLPEDARVYTTAPEEIKRALRASLVASAARGERATKAPAAATGKASRQLSGRRGERTTETTAAPAPGGDAGRTALPLPVALTATLILVLCAGALTSSVATRRRGRALLADPQRDAVSPVADRPHPDE